VENILQILGGIVGGGRLFAATFEKNQLLKAGKIFKNMVVGR
jgi:hypothetical protein